MNSLEGGINNQLLSLFLGILTSRWRCLRNAIDMKPKNAEKIILGCLILHNFLRTHAPTDDEYAIRNEVQAMDIDGLERNRRNRASLAALSNRDKLRDHLVANTSY